MWQGMTDEAGERLGQLGVESEGIESLIEAECIRAYNYVLGVCNIEMMPEILKPVCIDMACAAVISAAEQNGSLSLTDTGRLSSIKEGDITLGFESGAALVDTLLKRLDFNDKSLLISYRRLKW